MLVGDVYDMANDARVDGVAGRIGACAAGARPPELVAGGGGGCRAAWASEPRPRRAPEA
eukprot:NODE_6143_length_527_cov_1.512712.p5 GENE.NODE_6143_length_527_cov_1.512712~~NODE_6143_length_527_cov_1.512712.p5  ORF type:complete len:59 (+),score=3.88 NODE_6143_length_527_cov_1.512712:170-346(+)